MTLTDRSRIIEFKRCPRARWWGYEFGRGTKSPAGGVSRTAANVPLTTGIFTHVGIAALLRFTQGLDKPIIHEDPVQAAVFAACSSFAEEIRARGIDVETGGDPAFTAREQEALIEGMIRAWATVRLPVLLAEYEVVDVEREELMLLMDDDLTLQSRPDALLRRRDDGSLAILSLKTAASWDDRQERSNRHDDQGLSEIAAVEWRLREDQARLLTDACVDVSRLAGAVAGAAGVDWNRASLDAEKLLAIAKESQHIAAKSTTVDSVLMDFLLKGERRQDRAEDGAEAGPYRQHSPLIRGYCRQKTDPVTLEVSWEYAWSYYWTCVEPHTATWKNGREVPCDGGKRHGLGNSWSPFNVWEVTDPFRIATPNGIREFPPGVKGWIEMLNAGVVQPEAGPCLPAQFVTPVPYFRQQQDIEDWLAQAITQEFIVAEEAEMIRRCEDPEVIRGMLNDDFPQNRRACDWPTRCPFIEVCHETPGHAGQIDPLALGGVYRPREPHHEAELRSVTTEVPTQLTRESA